jgi:RNA polymerase sigma factor (sigma-70 family)
VVRNNTAHHLELLRSAQSGDRHARELLLVDSLPLVRGVASRYRGVGLPFDDLVQEGSVGLLEAIEDFDPDVGVEFAGYARFRVHRAIRNALTERARLVRLPKHIVERRRLVLRESARGFAATGHAPSATELAERTGLPIETVRATLDAGIDAVSLDAPVTPDGSSLEELVADPAALDPEAVVVERDSVRRVDEAVEHLPERQRQIVEHAFGLGVPPESIADVAAEFHLSPQRTRTIVLDALHKLERELQALGSLVTGALLR